ncbi:MAG TPA: hypothetical protein VFP93_03435 [Gammaproteobacteria bacterium]|nr:hypothetical protein [Gammaproteobacteria bacterium]
MYSYDTIVSIYYSRELTDVQKLVSILKMPMDVFRHQPSCRILDTLFVENEEIRKEIIYYYFEVFPNLNVQQVIHDYQKLVTNDSIYAQLRLSHNHVLLDIFLARMDVPLEILDPSIM